ncbi:hypothetical protein DM790_23810 [Flavobacterium collinsii]|nr:hypothetical protein [Flavobacterium collinsii]
MLVFRSFFLLSVPIFCVSLKKRDTKEFSILSGLGGFVFIITDFRKTIGLKHFTFNKTKKQVFLRVEQIKLKTMFAYKCNYQFKM